MTLEQLRLTSDILEILHDSSRDWEEQKSIVKVQAVVGRQYLKKLRDQESEYVNTPSSPAPEPIR